MSKQYYLLSIKWSEGKGNVTWWGPNDSGYTQNINDAGIYSEERINSRKLYYSNKGVMPVEVEKAQAANKHVVVLNDSDNTELFGVREHYKNAEEY